MSDNVNQSLSGDSLAGTAVSVRVKAGRGEAAPAWIGPVFVTGISETIGFALIGFTAGSF